VISTLQLAHVKFLPRELTPGVLYVSREYAVAGHLCACGCGNKVMTPLGPAEWSFSERDGRPALRPSIGNWQLPCRSHYVITDGRILWADQWSDTQILAGRQAEESRRQAHYAALDRERGFWRRLWKYVRALFSG
jgi:hypothetical protein